MKFEIGLFTSFCISDPNFGFFALRHEFRGAGPTSIRTRISRTTSVSSPEIIVNHSPTCSIVRNSNNSRLRAAPSSRIQYPSGARDNTHIQPPRAVPTKRRADRICVEAGRAGHACRGDPPQNRDQRRDVLIGGRSTVGCHRRSCAG